MVDDKQVIIDGVVLKMNLDPEQSNKLKNLMWMEMHDFSVTRIMDTEIVVRDETFNEEALRMFFVAKSVQGCTKRTLKHYGNTIRQFTRFINDKQLNQVTTNDIRYYMAIKKERDGNSDVQINNIRLVLSSLFGWLMEEEYIEKNPIAKIKKIRVEKRVKKPFSEDEIEKIRYGARDDVRLTALIEVMMSTGCRISEVSGMNRSDVDGDEIIVYGKGKKERTVFLNAKAKQALNRYLATRTDKNDPLFVSMDKNHKRLLVSQMGKEIRMLGRENGVNDTHPHRFRRTSATIALNRGMPIDQVQMMLGHESIETTTMYAISAQEAVKANHKKYVV